MMLLCDSSSSDLDTLEKLHKQVYKESELHVSGSSL